VKGILDAGVVRLGPEGRTLYEQSGYGRVEKDGLKLSPAEALYLIHRGKVEVPGHDFDSLLSVFAEDPVFIRSYLVYRDIRERGYAVSTGPHDFRVFRRGQRPGSGESQYLVRVLSERDLIDFRVARAEVTTSSNMRKQYVLAVVDDENELTYYQVREHQLSAAGSVPAIGTCEAYLAGKAAVVQISEGSALDQAFFGTRLDPGRLMLSSLEVLFLMEQGSLTLVSGTERLSPASYLAIVRDGDSEVAEKALVYSDLRILGYTPRTGYKYGHHFRVYSAVKLHSEMLVHAVPEGVALPMSTISRSVRMAHSVKKKMLFACTHEKGISYLEYARMKL
jgi:tRNA-intron endonuclease